MPLVPAKCTSCGATLTLDPSQDAAVCPFCNTPFIVEKAINNYTTVNHYNITAETVIVQNDRREELYKAKEYNLMTEEFPADWRGWWGCYLKETKNVYSKNIYAAAHNLEQAWNFAPSEAKPMIRSALVENEKRDRHSLMCLREEVSNAENALHDDLWSKIDNDPVVSEYHQALEHLEAMKSARKENFERSSQAAQRLSFIAQKIAVTKLRSEDARLADEIKQYESTVLLPARQRYYECQACKDTVATETTEKEQLNKRIKKARHDIRNYEHLLFIYDQILS